jgi:hypothetical protein
MFRNIIVKSIPGNNAGENAVLETLMPNSGKQFTVTSLGRRKRKFGGAGISRLLSYRTARYKSDTESLLL